MPTVKIISESKAHPTITSKTLVGEAVAYMLAHPELTAEYLADCIKYEWLEQEFRTSPQWAEWFVRHCVIDHWPTAEPLLREDIQRYSDYQRYISLLRQLGMIGYSTGEHYFAQIDPAQYEEEAYDADRIAAAVDWFRRQRAAQQQIGRGDSPDDPG